VRILSANAGDRSVKADANPNSIVLMVTSGNRNFFLMGDSTELTEEVILGNLGKDLKELTKNRRSVLKVGHHGSRTSSSQAWLAAVRPQIAFISSDTRSFSGVSIPRSDIVQRIFNLKTLHDFGKPSAHYFVQYNDSSERHEQGSLRPFTGLNSTRIILGSRHTERVGITRVSKTMTSTSYRPAAGKTSRKLSNPKPANH
jgi:hypothetical protein